MSLIDKFLDINADIDNDFVLSKTDIELMVKNKLFFNPTLIIDNSINNNDNSIYSENNVYKNYNILKRRNPIQFAMGGRIKPFGFR
tara:strand:- start:1676 stop:1933 length:258 start_codon:yes stop_codon:yes gene_type:complete